MGGLCCKKEDKNQDADNVESAEEVQGLTLHEEADGTKVWVDENGQKYSYTDKLRISGEGNHAKIDGNDGIKKYDSIEVSDGATITIGGLMNLQRKQDQLEQLFHMQGMPHLIVAPQTWAPAYYQPQAQLA